LARSRSSVTPNPALSTASPRSRPRAETSGRSRNCLLLLPLLGQSDLVQEVTRGANHTLTAHTRQNVERASCRCLTSRARTAFAANSYPRSNLRPNPLPLPLSRGKQCRLACRNATMASSEPGSRPRLSPRLTCRAPRTPCSACRRVVPPLDLAAGQGPPRKVVHYYEPAQQVCVALPSGLPSLSSLTLTSLPRLLISSRPANYAVRPAQTAKIVKDVTQLVLARRTRMCNFLEYKGASTPLRSRCLTEAHPRERHTQTPRSSTAATRASSSSAASARRTMSSSRSRSSTGASSCARLVCFAFD